MIVLRKSMNKALSLISKSLPNLNNREGDIQLINASSEFQDVDFTQVSVLPDAHVLDVLKLMSEYDLSVVPVVDEGKNYLGSITSADLLDHLADMLGVMKEGGIIVLQVLERDHSIQQIARIIEENNAKILSLSVLPVSEGNLEIHIKIDLPDLNPILQSLERFNYIVLSKFQASQYDNELKDRYDELMRYLNM